MPFVLDDLVCLTMSGFDEIIDVRSPAEFATDHLPGAVNLPVLDDAERARVGTIYVQEDPFRARKIGAALVARNAARHIENHLADRDGSYRPLVYCWRGGLRSGAFATILSQIGWRAETLAGGYAAYRRLIVRLLYGAPLGFRLLLLDGNTGTAKTALLGRLGAAGHQVLDLEGLTNHRGSIFGALPGGQPTQKAFESRLAARLAAFDPGRPLLAEAESSRLGRITLPPALWSAIRSAPRIEIAAPVAERARYLVRTYGDAVGDTEALERTLSDLTRFHGRETVAEWQALAREGALEKLAAELVTRHYDPGYARQRTRMDRVPGMQIALDDLTERGIDRAAERIAAALAGL